MKGCDAAEKKVLEGLDAEESSDDEAVEFSDASSSGEVSLQPFLLHACKFNMFLGQLFYSGARAVHDP